MTKQFKVGDRVVIAKHVYEFGAWLPAATEFGIVNAIISENRDCYGVVVDGVPRGESSPFDDWAFYANELSLADDQPERAKQ